MYRLLLLIIVDDFFSQLLSSRCGQHPSRFATVFAGLSLYQLGVLDQGERPGHGGLVHRERLREIIDARTRKLVEHSQKGELSAGQVERTHHPIVRAAL